MEPVDGRTVQAEFCSFTKAIEHLGDRWTLLIVRELGMRGPKGFSALAADLPGRISRSVLSERLNRLVVLGLVTRSDDPHGYALTSIGEGLVPVLDGLRTWSYAWLPDDPDAVRRDPAVLLGWLGQRVTGRDLPRPAVVLEFKVVGGDRYWLVLEDGAEPYGCETDPLLARDRYIVVDTSLPTLVAFARGRATWQEVRREASAALDGDPDLTQAVPGWFAKAQPASR